jgi:tRNA (mo5U34)-methyltransferase
MSVKPRLGPKWSDEQINTELSNYNYWYHKVNLSEKITTPGMNLEPIWENIDKVRKNISYKGKDVLDIATFDGKFAFDAENLGAKTVVATDCLYKSFNNFLFCKQVLGSRVIPFFNISPYNLTERLDVYFDENYDNELPNSRFFDVVQHFGLLYHLQNPLYSLAQARSVLKLGGHLIIETDILLDEQQSILLFNGIPNFTRVRDNSSVWWAPTKTSLFEMLEINFFEVLHESYSQIEFKVPVSPLGSLKDGKKLGQFNIGRACVIAKAIPSIINDNNGKVSRELLRTYRNPGLDPYRIQLRENG